MAPTDKVQFWLLATLSSFSSSYFSFALAESSPTVQAWNITILNNRQCNTNLALNKLSDVVVKSFQ